MYFPLSFWLILYGSLLQCRANDTTMCQRFDARTKSLERYCENGRQTNRPQNCAALQMQSIETYQVAELKMTGCDYYAVSEALIKYKYVTSVTVQYSRNFDVSVRLDRLKALNASQNAIEIIPMDLFSRVPELESIDLSHNVLAQLEWGSFQHARNLRQIHLAHNLLRTIQPEIIVRLNNLESIDLRANQLYSIPDYSGNKHLNVIDLQENPITAYDCFHMSTMQTVAVHLTWSNLATFDGAWHCKGKHILIQRNIGAAAAAEGLFPSESHGKFQLHCNDRSFKNLREFVAGQNAFQNIVEILPCFDATLELIDLSGNSVMQLDSNVFRRFNRLKLLRLTNTNLQRFDFNLIPQPNRLNSLDLSLNSNLHLDHLQLLMNGFTVLHEFKIAGNKLENLPQIVEHLNEPIEILDVSGNFLGTINANVFRHLRRLKVLNVSDTVLSISNVNPFELIPLLSLDVSRNNLEHANFSVLSTTLAHLQYFYATHSHIKNPIDIFHSLRSSIVEINLSGNEIQSIETESLQNLVNLVTLDVSSNKMRTIEFQVTLNKLQSLKLDNNDLNRINGLIRSQFRSLKTIDVAKNQLDCKNVQQLIRDWENSVDFGNNEQLIQTHVNDDQLCAQDDLGVLTKIYHKIKFW